MARRTGLTGTGGRLALLLLIALVSSVLVAAVGAPGASRTAGSHRSARGVVRLRPRHVQFVRRSVLVRVRPGVDARAVLARHRLRLVGRITHTSFVRAVGRGSTQQMLRSLAGDKRVAVAEPNFIRHLDAEPNDRLYAKARSQGYLETIRAPEAWDRTSNCSGATVAVVDDGVDATNPDLAGRVLPAHSFLPAGYGEGQHGTMVAGVVAAVANNGIGVAGLCWTGKVLPVVVASNDYATDANLANGITWAADNGASVINLSLGGPGRGGVLKSAIDYALSKDVVVVASAGNSATSVPQYPAAYPGVVAVGGTNWDGTIASFSSWGPWVDLVAPAVQITTTSQVVSTFRGFATVDGTSFSAPMVAATAALIRTQSPSLSAAQVATRIERTARDAGQLGVDDRFGHGILDVAAAVGAPLAQSTPPVPGDSGEPNDTPQRATPLTLGVDRSATIAPEGEVDWYRLDIATPTDLAVAVWGASSIISADVSVYGPSLEQLASRWQWMSPDVVMPAGTPGTYYIRVSNHTAATMDYVINVRASGSPPSPWSAWEWLPSTGDGLGFRSTGVALGDLNGDGRRDVALSTDRWGDPPYGAEVLVYSQRADGTLAAPTVVGGLGQGNCCTALVTADFNGDGKTDLAVARDQDAQVFFQEGGALVPGPTIAVNQLWTIRAADLNGDGRADLVLGGADGLFVATSAASGFTLTPIDPVRAADTAIGDLNGDGRPDIALAVSGTYVATLLTFIQNPNGSFTKSAIAPATDEPGALVAIALGDFNGDGRTDIAGIGEKGDPSTLAVYPQLAAGGFGQPTTLAAGNSVQSLEAADVNGDGRADLVAGPYSSSGYGQVEIFLQRPDGGMASADVVPFGDGFQRSHQLAVGDINGDSFPDIVSAGTVMRRRSSWRAPAAWIADASPAAGATGVSTNTTATVTFGRPIDASSVTAATVYLADAHGNHIAGTLSYDAASRRAAVSATGLAANSAYTLEIDGVKDSAGYLLTATAATRFLTGRIVDVTAPDTFITGPFGTAELVATEPGARFECSIDDGAFSPCTSSPVLPLTQGHHTLAARAIDPAGNVDQTPATMAWNTPVRQGTPPNHNLQGAVTITGASGTVAGSNAFFGGWDTPDVAGSRGGQEMWYRWTSPSTGPVTFDTAGSNFDTVLGVYTGTRVDNLVSVAENDDPSNGALAAKVTFDATAGTTYLVDVDGFGDWRSPYDMQTGDFALSWSATGATAPTNDAFADSLTLAGSAGSATGDTTSATRETGEPLIVGNPGGHSVWFSWTPSVTGTATVDSHGSRFDSTLAAYTGSSLGTLTKLTENDDSESLQSAITFAVTAGTTYRLQIDGYNGTSHPPWFGNYTLNWSVTAGPAPGPGTGPTNDAFAAAAAVSGSNGTATGSSAGASKENGEPNHAGATGGASIWFAWTAPASGLVTFDTAGSTFDTLLAAYTGSSVSVLTQVAANDDAAPGTYTSQIQFDAQAGTTYRVAVDGWSGQSGPVSLHWTQSAPSPRPGGPPNDAFASAASISGANGTATGSTTGATKEPGEPNHAGHPGGASIWFAWTAPASGQVTFDTAGSAFDTLMGVYTGPGVTSLTQVAANDDAPGTFTSQVTFAATAGSTYRIAVDGWSGQSGSVSMHWAGAVNPPPPRGTPGNDMFASAVTLEGATGTFTENSTGATKENGEPNHAGSVGGASVWFKWTASSTGPVTIDTAGSTFDTLLAAYTGPSLSALTAVAANDDATGGTYTSEVAFNATAGTTYRIAVDGWSAQTGLLTVHWHAP